ncbi:MAG: amidohydrolase family protein [Mycobacteriales bacterium]
MTTYDLFSVDDHIIEPRDVWTSRLPAKYAEDAPHVVEEDGREYWVWEGTKFPQMGLNAVAGKPQEEWDMEPVRFSDMIPGCYDPKARAEDMLADNIRASLCFPTLAGFGGRVLNNYKDKELASLCVQAYNDFHIDEWCAAAPELFVPMIVGQVWDPTLMAAEIRRCSAKGARAISFPEGTVSLGLPSLFSDYWNPVWQACEETETVICMHIGSSGELTNPAPDGHFIIPIALGNVNAIAATVAFAMSPVPRKYPNIKLAMSEGGIGWVPSALERADRQFLKHRLHQGMDDLLPSEVWQRNIWGCMIDEPIGIGYRHQVGIDKIMWECDYPHCDTTWPNSQKDVDQLMTGIPEDEVAKMTHQNAEKLFRWKLGVGAV